MAGHRLETYVRNTLLEKSREYAGGGRRTPNSTRDACSDALRGTDTGWWNDLIYTSDIIDMFNKHRTSVLRAITDYMGETQADFSGTVAGFTYAELIVACTRRVTWTDYASDDAARARNAEAACYALRFAVEYLAGQTASELCPDL